MTLIGLEVANAEALPKSYITELIETEVFVACSLEFLSVALLVLRRLPDVAHANGVSMYCIMDWYRV